MLCQRSSRSFSAIFKPSRTLQAARKPHTTPSIRTYTAIPSLRPTIFSSTIRRSRVSSVAPFLSAQPTTTTSTAGTALDLLPKISSHPALGSIQVRCGPRNTFSPSHFVRKRRHGFLSRQKTRKGRATLLRRRLKRRSTLSH